MFYLFLNHLCYLENIFYTKAFAFQTLEKCIMSSVFFNFQNLSQMVFTCSMQ